jgi:hypothetical protein
MVTLKLLALEHIAENTAGLETSVTLQSFVQNTHDYFFIFIPSIVINYCLLLNQQMHM